MPCVMDFRMIPLDRNEAISQHIARLVEVVRASGLPYQTGPTVTVVEGSWQQLMELATRCFEENSKDSTHLLIELRIHWRKGRQGHLSGQDAPA
ncbi:hypothetical protein NNJEOMEG_00472 [Fundidesulfovibrio magnetotacticus]|uniref:Thiamine-binding protein domain-containing protein n=1 Tax=Fundidesulfovibrio magnetotacticus TaxID=2730080 RepID=A0A6V8LSQ6_9BACT|nr:thiamine-binding protein [Fundidesulfovibrio magnetotacticus]GFK92647.1 hypothetical protein NNJEOMEG_00472 [Fundidesulfovibrio magnetotacticus]